MPATVYSHYRYLIAGVYDVPTRNRTFNTLRCLILVVGQSELFRHLTKVGCLYHNNLTKLRPIKGNGIDITFVA
ncbi:hypothetical protein FACS189427_06120 [Planctomycetales bacterium]|nr:hypothetical protein FACS189427_06120 [Planctomycetales bacterium]